MYQVFVEKKEPFRAKEAFLKKEIEALLGYRIAALRMVHMYYSTTDFTAEVIETILAEPSQDGYARTLMETTDHQVLRVEFLPGQFDQRAYWANQAIRILGSEMEVHYSTIYLLQGVKPEDWIKVRHYFINPIESRERSLEDFSEPAKRSDPDRSFDAIHDVFTQEADSFIKKYNLSMNAEDVRFLRRYFENEGRAPTWTELKLIDTYWSDHCRHTTFMTELTDIDLSQFNVPAALEMHEIYHEQRKSLTKKPVSLMDLATFSARSFAFRADSDIEISEEINACSIERKVGGEDYLIMFKNETHNHPTEIEPFGGAATCLGGAIRDPLSGRAYVYQSMRITGAADPRQANLLPGKLSQKTIIRKAADGFSSYGNQIGLATGFVQEYYHPGFLAKRMELGFVIAAAAKAHVYRGTPRVGDLLLLLGGATGRDGIGGASGSSKSHQMGVLEGSSSEVQKGNAPEERKLQRFFRHPQIGPKIVRCNDLGAGGVSVGFGELADGLTVKAEHIPTKYQDIYPWELAISESQERMAVVIRPEDLHFFHKIAFEENLSCTVIGHVTEEARFTLTYKGKVFVDLKRDFLNASGAPRKAALKAVPIMREQYPYFTQDAARDELKWASQQGLQEQFDGSIGARTVLNPYGGKRLKTRVEGMVSLIPAAHNKTDVSVVSVGYDPYIAQWSPYHGGEYAVLESIAKNLVLGGDLAGLRFTFQEYFQKLGDKAENWAKPYLALLGANRILHHFALPSIGGKDSMSGTYQTQTVEIHVPPTLVSFAVNTTTIDQVITPELKAQKSYLALYRAYKNEDLSFALERTEQSYHAFLEQKQAGRVLAASVITDSPERAILNMAKGNGVGLKAELIQVDFYGSILAQLTERTPECIGTIEGDQIWINDRIYEIEQVIDEDESILKDLFELRETPGHKLELHRTSITPVSEKRDQVKVLLPVFPGTNCEDDMLERFLAAGAVARQWVFLNQTQSVEQSLDQLADLIEQCDILGLSGGFSAADEPEGSAKFITAVFRNTKVKEAFHRLLARGGLVIGICNGFQALVKLGVFMNDRIEKATDVKMGLTYNHLNRHQGKYVYTRAVSNASPWLKLSTLGETYAVPVSHGEGRFFAPDSVLEQLVAGGQVVSTYVDNPNGSMLDIEGIVSPSGQILGKMAHNERVGVARNVYHTQDQALFESAVRYLKGEI